MAKQVIYEEQKFWVFRNEEDSLCFYSEDCKPSNLLDEPLCGERFCVYSEDFLPFIKSGEKPALCAFRVVNSYNLKLRANVERGVATRNKYGAFVFLPASCMRNDYSLIYNSDFLQTVTNGALYVIEIKKLRK